MATESGRFEKVKLAYAEAQREQLEDDPAPRTPLPDWDKLPIEMRLAFVTVYSRGRRDAIAEVSSRLQ